MAIEMLSLEIQLLGRFQLRVERQPISPLPSRKGQWLLGLLALRQGQEVPRAWLAGTLWPDSEPSKGLRNLRQLLSDEIRPALGDAVRHLRSPVVSSLCLDQAGVSVDVTAFDAALAEGSVSALKSAVALYRGPLLEGCSEEWVLLERLASEQAYVAVLETLASRALAQGDPGGAVRYLRLLLAVDPFRETAYATLMQAFAECGDYAAVTQVYRDLRLLLHRELNAQPASETDALYKQLQQHSSASLSRSPVFPGLAPSLPPRSLPIPLTNLIGREQERDAVVGKLGTNRLVTLTGAGGVGKTRLALATGEALAKASPHSVWFVELASLTDPGLVPQTVAKTLGIEAPPYTPWMEALADRLATRSLLLVLDNCEHLVDACALLTETLLRTCAGLRVLCTSRQPLGITGEQIYRVPSLALPPILKETRTRDRVFLPPAEHNLSALIEYSAVRLFVDRALLGQPAFRVTPQNVSAVVSICQQLEGIPLAIEMAAARVRSLSVEEIARRLRNHFGFLRGNHTALPRHQTLRALMDWSHDLLTEPEQVLLRRLSVFVGGWTLEAAETVCAEGDLRERDSLLGNLLSLVDRSLVVYEQAENGPDRYSLLDTVRRYSQDRLTQSGEAEALRTRHRDFYLAWVETENFTLGGNPHVEQIQPEHANLRAALDWCQSTRDGAEPGLRLVAAMGDFWTESGYVQEARQCVERALSHPNVAPTKTWWEARWWQGYLAFFVFDCKTARPIFEECLSAFQKAQDTRGTALALIGLGALCHYEQDLPRAESCFEEALSLLQNTGDWPLMAWPLTYLGLLADEHGDYPTARALLEEAHSLDVQRGQHTGGARGLLGRVILAQGDYPMAHKILYESLVAYVQGSKIRFCFDMLSHLALLAFAQEQWERAATLVGIINSDTYIDERERRRGWQNSALNEAIVTLQTKMGAEAYGVACKAGRDFSREQMLSYIQQST